LTGRLDSSAGLFMSSFGARLQAAFADRGQLCLGIDPHPYLLAEWDLPDTPAGVRQFGLRVVDAAAASIGIVKPQVAFFERFGSAGFAALEDVIAAARASGLLVIADAKRGDVGTTVEAYGQAWLTPGSPLEADALTVSAFQGVGSLAGPIALATSTGKGLFVLAATSNPESVAPQLAVLSTGERAGATVAASIVREVSDYNARESLGSIGVVLGATLTLDDYGIEAKQLEHTPILAPGFGAQGARITQVSALYGAASRNVLVSVSRDILSAGSSDLDGTLSRYAAEVRGATGS
jgi:orotidine-5'-phosphate decarboxylase